MASGHNKLWQPSVVNNPSEFSNVVSTRHNELWWPPIVNKLSMTSQML